jgi:AraC-like DNA-binding protein
MTPGTEATRHGEGHPVLAIELDTSTFEAELQNRHGTDRVEWPRVPRALDLAEPRERELFEAITGLVHAHRPGPSKPSLTHRESRVLSALVGAMNSCVTGRITPVSIQRLNELEDWIDAHVGEAITLGRLCEVVQVGERSLQLAFQARRGMSPMRFVSERRLVAAQQRFSSARVDEDVTAIATSLGFTHFGRFSSAYRVAFGESPSQTLMRGRRWARTRNVAESARIGHGR